MIEHKPSLVGTEPSEVSSHGPTKIYVSKYIWHSPKVGIVASYTPRAHDVHDHFGVFRGVDQVEAFGQATTGACLAYSETVKQNCTFEYLKTNFTPFFTSIGQVEFRGYLLEGETFICMGYITFYKFRKMTCNGRIYKVPAGLNLDDYFKEFTDDRLLNYDIDERFQLIAELNDITGQAIKKEKHKHIVNI